MTGEAELSTCQKRLAPTQLTGPPPLLAVMDPLGFCLGSPRPEELDWRPARHCTAVALASCAAPLCFGSPGKNGGTGTYGLPGQPG